LPDCCADHARNAVKKGSWAGNLNGPSALTRMADDNEIVVRFLNMLRGSLDEKNQRLLEELRLKRSVILSRPQPDFGKPSTTLQKDEDSGPGLSSGVAA